MSRRRQVCVACLQGLLLVILSSHSTHGQQQQPSPPTSPPSPSEPRCYDNAPDNCSFLCGGTCGWFNESGWAATNTSSPNWSLKLSDAGIGSLTSRLACPSEGGSGSGDHCLTFWYRFQRDFVIKLSVLVKVEGSDGVQGGEAVEVWKLRKSPNGRDSWAEAKVRLNSTVTSSGRGFRVTIQSERFRFDYKQDSVFVDAVRYSRSPCSTGDSSSAGSVNATSSLQPPEDDYSAESDACARLISTTPVPSTTPTTTTTTTTVRAPASSSAADTEETTDFMDTGKSGTSGNIGSNGVSKGTTDVDNDEGDGKSESSSVNAGMIVGVVFAVIAIIAIAIFVVIFVFRKQLRS